MSKSLPSPITFVVGNLINEEVDAIVNPANELLIAGGGVDGEIHRVAGKELVEAKKSLGGCEIGEAKHTLSYGLKAPYIIHTVAPRFNHPLYKYKNGEDLLFSCYQNSLNLAKKIGCKSIAFPALGTGAYGWPHDISAKIAMEAISSWFKNTGNFIQIRFMLLNEEIALLYKNEWDSVWTKER